MTENGKAAYEELKDENKDFDLVLLDLYMPEMDGFELLSLMQEDERLRTIPVVVMTANDTNEIAANCLSKQIINLTVNRDGCRQFSSETHQNSGMQGSHEAHEADTGCTESD